LQFTPADTQSKIAKEYVFANAEKDKSQWLTKYKKHRADKGFREFSAFNKHSACLTVKCFEMPYDFLYRPLGFILKKESQHKQLQLPLIASYDSIRILNFETTLRNNQ
jgi:hypothetical protein